MKLQKPHNLLSRLLQIGAVVGMAGLLYWDASATDSQNPVLPALSTEAVSEDTESSQNFTEKITETTALSETVTTLESFSETESEPASETEILSESESERETETESEAEAKSESRFSLLFQDGVPSPEEFEAALHCWIPYVLNPAYAEQLSWENLEASLEEKIDSCQGTWSLCLKDLSTGKTITIHDEPQASASLIKLYIMGAVLEKASEDGLLPLMYSSSLATDQTQNLQELLNEMIVISDNDAANRLVEYLDEDGNHASGMEKVNDFIKRHGFSDTVQYNGLGNSDYWYDIETLNQTSAKDCVNFLEQVYDGTLVSHLASRFMESLLMNQEITYKIAASLPEDAITASKSGETNDTENDAAIVFSPGGDYILCILSTALDPDPDPDAGMVHLAVDELHELSQMVYEYFN